MELAPAVRGRAFDSSQPLVGATLRVAPRGRRAGAVQRGRRPQGGHRQPRAVLHRRSRADGRRHQAGRTGRPAGHLRHGQRRLHHRGRTPGAAGGHRPAPDCVRRKWPVHRHRGRRRCRRRPGPRPRPPARQDHPGPGHRGAATPRRAADLQSRPPDGGRALRRPRPGSRPLRLVPQRRPVGQQRRPAGGVRALHLRRGGAGPAGLGPGVLGPGGRRRPSRRRPRPGGRGPGRRLRRAGGRRRPGDAGLAGAGRGARAGAGVRARGAGRRPHLLRPPGPPGRGRPLRPADPAGAGGVARIGGGPHRLGRHRRVDRSPSPWPRPWPTTPATAAWCCSPTCGCGPSRPSSTTPATCCPASRSWSRPTARASPPPRTCGAWPSPSPSGSTTCCSGCAAHATGRPSAPGVRGRLRRAAPGVGRRGVRHRRRPRG